MLTFIQPRWRMTSYYQAVFSSWVRMRQMIVCRRWRGPDWFQKGHLIQTYFPPTQLRERPSAPPIVCQSANKKRDLLKDFLVAFSVVTGDDWNHQCSSPTRAYAMGFIINKSTRICLIWEGPKPLKREPGRWLFNKTPSIERAPFFIWLAHWHNRPLSSSALRVPNLYFVSGV